MAHARKTAHNFLYLYIIDTIQKFDDSYPLVSTALAAGPFPDKVKVDTLSSVKDLIFVESSGRFSPIKSELILFSARCHNAPSTM